MSRTVQEGSHVRLVSPSNIDDQHTCRIKRTVFVALTRVTQCRKTILPKLQNVQGCENDANEPDKCLTVTATSILVAAAEFADLRQLHRKRVVQVNILCPLSLSEARRLRLADSH